MKNFVNTRIKELCAILSLLIVACSFTGCYEDMGPDSPNVSGIELSENHIEAESSYSTYSVTVKSDYPWVASTSDSWIIIHSNSGNAGESYLSFSVESNISTSRRDGEITIFCDSYNTSATLTVSQAEPRYPFNITLSLETSRTTIGEKVDGFYPLYWLPEDKVGCNGLVSCHTAIDDSSNEVATFSFNTTTQPPYHIIYPAQPEDIMAMKEGCYPIVFKAKQHYMNNTFDPAAAPIMYCYATDRFASLTHLSGVLKLSINGNGEALSHIVVSAEKGYISGIFDLDCETGVFTAQDGNVSNQIEVYFDGGLQLHPEDAAPIYITIPSGSYGKVSLSIYTTDGISMTVLFDSDKRPISANSIREFQAFTFYAN